MAEATHDRPLTGIRVIDVTTVLMEPFATQMLGDMGADIIKIEPLQGDSHRTVGRAHSPDLGLNFLNTGRNKRSLALDLKHPDAKAIVAGLVKDADVFISNMRPAALKRLGFDYTSLQAVNDRLIHVSLVGFGRGGRYAGLPAYDDLIQAAVGIPWLIQQGSGAEPAYVPLALCDRVVGVAGAQPDPKRPFRARAAQAAVKSKCRCSRRWFASPWATISVSRYISRPTALQAMVVCCRVIAGPIAPRTAISASCHSTTGHGASCSALPAVRNCFPAIRLPTGPPTSTSSTGSCRM
jgi:hypothetical protein